MRSIQETRQFALGSVPGAEQASAQGTRSVKLTARRYVLPLDARRFAPYVDCVAEWKGIVATAACGLGMKFELHTGPPRYRKCWYVDSVDGCLRRNGFSLQVMDEGFRDKRYRIRLNGAHRDRYLAMVSDVSGRNRTVRKFEEEIFPTFSRYVRSAEERRYKLPCLHTVADLIRLFPGLDQHLGDRRREAVTIADGMVGSELVDLVGEGSMNGAGPIVCKLTASYCGNWRVGRRIDGELEKHMPDSVDFTFSYKSLPGGGAMERFPRANIVAGCGLLETLYAKRGWMDHDRSTSPPV